MKLHKLKLNIEFCDAVFSGKKTFEVRLNDRGYQTGDRIKFIPVNNQGIIVNHKIEKTEYKITYLLNGWGIKNGYVVLAITELPFTEWSLKNDTTRNNKSD